MRKHFIDNLRIFCILLLFPFHTCMIYNNWGELFYITGKPYTLPSTFVYIVYPWWMTLLFTLAGISSSYALQSQTPKEYALERVHKLLIPLLAGLAFIIPIQSYIADVFYNGYSGGYLAHYQIFFTRFTYLTGQDGGFTPGHLWFILYLFVISLVMLPIMYLYNRSARKIEVTKLTVPMLLPFFLVILLCTPLLEIGGKSIGESLACFAIGFFLLSRDEIQEKLEKSSLLLTVLFLASIGVRLFVIALGDGKRYGLFLDIEQRLVLWFGILALLSLGKKYWNGSNQVTRYFSKAAFPLYFFHQSILVILGYVSLRLIRPVWLQAMVIMIGSFVCSLFCYELVRRFRVTSFLFGIKWKQKSVAQSYEK